MGLFNACLVWICSTHVRRNGECIWAAWVCDKESDCFEGEDEDAGLCAGREVCGAGRFQCELSGSCVDLAKVYLI